MYFVSQENGRQRKQGESSVKLNVEIIIVALSRQVKLCSLERFNRLRTLSLLQKHAVCRQQPLKGPLLIDWKVQCNRAYARWCRRLWWGHRGGSGSGGHGCVGYVCGAGFGLVVVVIDVDFGAARVRAPIIVKCLWFHRLLPRFSTNILVSPSQIFVASLRQWWSLCLSLCLSWYWCWLRSGSARGGGIWGSLSSRGYDRSRGVLVVVLLNMVVVVTAVELVVLVCL